MAHCSDFPADDLIAIGDSAGGDSGLRMLRIEQQIDGRPVFQSESRFLLARDGRLAKYVGQLMPHARSFAPVVDAASLMTPAQAIVKLLAFEGRTASTASFTVSNETDGRIKLAETDDYVAGEISARQVLFPLSPGMLVSAWSLVVFTTGEADWYAVIDEQTGDVLWRKNMRDYASAHDARFRVYVQADGITPADSPAPNSPKTNSALAAGAQLPGIAPTIVSMHAAYDAVASPNGWINDCPAGVCTANETQTLGNNVVVCMDQAQGGDANICDTAAATVIDGNGRATGNPDANGRNRDFLGTAPRDFQTNYLPPPQAGNPEAGQTATGSGTSGTAPVDQFRRGMMTNLFYVTNWYHDQLYKLGFDEASGNFQLTNFSGQGLGNDRVNGDADDGSGTNNANFSTPPDGTSGRMQMYRFTGPTIDRDGALDAEVSMHEMTHGTSNRLIGNGAGLNWDPARGMGEGWSDFYALSLLNSSNANNPNGRYASGGYATYKLTATYLDNYTYGIRRFPYSTDNTVNPLTWADVDDVTNNLSGGIAPDPIGFNNNGGMEVHNIGEVWALTLWEVRARVIADPAGANGDVPTGSHKMLQLATDAMKMTPINPTFIDARDALLQADCATNACANEGSIWGGFADRGLGYGARAPYAVMGRYVSSHEAIHESFGVPFLDVLAPATDVTIDDSLSNNNGKIDPGEAVKLTVKLSNPWRAASKAITNATATLSTTTPGVTIYDNQSTYGAIAPQGSATGDSFMLTVDPTVLCGSAIDFTVTTVSSLGTTSTNFRLRVGGASGTDPVVTYTGTPSPALTILNSARRGVFHQINVTDDFEIADINFRIDSITHPGVGDITVMLRSPDGTGSDLVALVDGLNDFGGTSITNMVIDDDVPATVANDMVQATTANAPYTKSWLPVYNSPWAAIVAATLPADTVGNLSRHDGKSSKGTWTALVADVFTAAAGGTDGTGTFAGWSILVTPVHFACTAFAPTVSIAATKTVSGTFKVNGTVTYTVTLTNNGTANQGDNAGHEFVDVLPIGLALVSATATTGTAITTGNTVNWDGALAPLGGSTTITITATVIPGTQGTLISNQGTVNYDSNNDGSNDATLLTDDPGIVGSTDPTVFSVANVNILATKTVAGTFSAGGTVTYTVVLSNNGSAASLDNAGNEFSDILPATLTLVSATATTGTAVATIGTNTVTWNGSVAAGNSVTVTIAATVNSGVASATSISNQASVSYDADLNGTNETSIVTDDPTVAGANNPTTFVVSGAAVSATKTVTGSFVVGGTVTYNVVLSNAGNAATSDNPGNEFTDVLPAGLTLVSATVTTGTAVATIGTETVTWNGSIPAAGNVTITITATINSGTLGTTISNQGSYSYDADLNGTNESSGLTDDPAVAGAANPTTFAVGGALISGTKTVSGSFVVGGTVNYSIVLANTGPSASADNVGDELTDILPIGLTLVSATATSGVALATIATHTATWNGGIAAGGTVTITITATITATAAGHQLSNQATFAYDADLNGTNETTGVTDDPTLPGANNATVFSVAALAEPAKPVPSLSILSALLLMIGMLSMAALVNPRRRQS